MLRQKEPKNLAGWNIEHALLWVEHEVDPTQVCKSFFQVLHEHGPVLGFDYYIIQVSFHISMELGLKTIWTARANVEPALFNPKGIRTKQYVPHGVMNAVFSSSSFVMKI